MGLGLRASGKVTAEQQYGGNCAGERTERAAATHDRTVEPRYGSPGSESD